VVLPAPFGPAIATMIGLASKSAVTFGGPGENQ
jgi:hypothetical protein